MALMARRKQMIKSQRSTLVQRDRIGRCEMRWSLDHARRPARSNASSAVPHGSQHTMVNCGARVRPSLAPRPRASRTNILAERLKRLEEAGIIARAAYHQRPARYAYTLTAKGRERGGVLLALVGWGKRPIAGTRTLAEIAPAAAMRTPVRKSAPSRDTRGAS